MRTARWWALLLVFALGAVGCGGEGAEVPSESAGVPNPASVYCEEQGGTLELREAADGSTAGYCVFDDGSECEEWAFQRGECAPGGAPSEVETVDVEVFFANAELGDPCGEVFPVPRTVPVDDAMASTLTSLLAGPTDDERAEGYEGWFGPETTGVLRSVAVEGTTVEVDFADLREVIPNASSSCGSAGLLAQLDRTLLQFPAVERTLYHLEGSADAFYEWLQMDVPASP